jgi:hypothetical protein
MPLISQIKSAPASSLFRPLRHASFFNGSVSEPLNQGDARHLLVGPEAVNPRDKTESPDGSIVLNESFLTALRSAIADLDKIMAANLVPEEPKPDD